MMNIELDKTVYESIMNSTKVPRIIYNKCIYDYTVTMPMSWLRTYQSIKQEFILTQGIRSNLPTTLLTDLENFAKAYHKLDVNIHYEWKNSDLNIYITTPKVSEIFNREDLSDLIFKAKISSLSTEPIVDYNFVTNNDFLFVYNLLKLDSGISVMLNDETSHHIRQKPFFIDSIRTKQNDGEHIDTETISYTYLSKSYDKINLSMSDYHQSKFWDVRGYFSTNSHDETIWHHQIYK